MRSPATEHWWHGQSYSDATMWPAVLNMNFKEEKATDKKLNGIAKRKINRKAVARQRKRPDAAERAENAMLVAASGIPSI